MRHLPFMPDMGSFPAGTRIQTTQGELPVEDITAGARVMTPAGENVTVTDVESRKVRFFEKPHWGKPVLLPAGSLGNGLPVRDLILPPGQLLAVADLSPIDLIARADVLIPAIAARKLPGARQLRGRRKLRLFSVVTERPCLILAEGVATESTRPMASRLASRILLGHGALGRHPAGPRVLSARKGQDLIAQLRQNGDLPDRPPGRRENELMQWDEDLAKEQAAARQRHKKAG